MLPIKELLYFTLAAFAIVITPGPNMIYLISRSITQGKKAGVISLAGVVGGFLFHIIMVAYGLTAVLLAVPFTFTALKISGAFYLFYLAWNAIKPGSKNIFEIRKDLKADKPARLFVMGFLTNVLNPKMAIFYLSLFPQFIKPEAGSVIFECFQLGFIQMTISAAVNFLIIISAAKAAKWFSKNPVWVKAQKGFMATVLTTLAIKMLFSKAR